MTVFFDIDTQNDFLFPGGALYGPGAEGIVETVVALNRFAARQGFPVISTTDAHTPDDPEFADWPPHCVTGTEGQKKPASTLLADRLIVPSAPREVDLSGSPEQIILEKQTIDCFSNPNLAGILDHFDAERYVIYGVFTEICVRYAAEGLWKYLEDRAAEAEVWLVTDAVKQLKEEARDAFFREFQANDGVLTTSAELMSS